MQRLVDRVLIIALVSSFVVLSQALPAEADLVEVDAEERQGVVSGMVVSSGERSGEDGGPSCEWSSSFLGADDDRESNGRREKRLPGGDHTETMYRIECPDGSVSYRWVPDVTAADLTVSLLDHVRERLPAPEPVLEPFDDENRWVYVQTPIDFRTSVASWEPIVATASVSGPPGLSPWVTITATPTELLFVSGDPWDAGVVARCSGDGPVAAYVADVPGACSYTYRNASSVVEGWRFPAEMAIRWEVSYDSSAGPGTLDMDPTVTEIPLRVAEIKGLVTCTGPMPEQGGC